MNFRKIEMNKRATYHQRPSCAAEQVQTAGFAGSPFPSSLPPSLSFSLPLPLDVSFPLCFFRGGSRQPREAITLWIHACV